MYRGLARNVQFLFAIHNVLTEILSCWSLVRCSWTYSKNSKHLGIAEHEEVAIVNTLNARSFLTRIVVVMRHLTSTAHFERSIGVIVMHFVTFRGPANHPISPRSFQLIWHSQSSFPKNMQSSTRLYSTINLLNALCTDRPNKIQSANTYKL